jgi:hypothetical protein
MPVKCKWSSKKGRALAEEIKHELLSGNWGDIFDPNFRIDNVEWKDLKESNPEWDSSFDSKQFREKVSRLVARLISKQEAADGEAADIGLGPRRRGNGKALFADSPHHIRNLLISHSFSSLTHSLQVQVQGQQMPMDLPMILVTSLLKIKTSIVLTKRVWQQRSPGRRRSTTFQNLLCTPP